MPPPVSGRRGQDRAGDLVARVRDRDAERPARAAQVARAEAVVLDRPVGGKHLRPRPAGVAARGEPVPVGRRPAQPHHPVDRRRPAEYPPAQPDLGLPARQRRGGRVPVQVTVAAERVVEPLRNVEQRVHRPPAVLDQQHAGPRAGRREPPGDHAPGRPCPDDDVVELHAAILARPGRSPCRGHRQPPRQARPDSPERELLNVAPGAVSPGPRRRLTRLRPDVGLGAERGARRVGRRALGRVPGLPRRDRLRPVTADRHGPAERVLVSPPAEAGHGREAAAGTGGAVGEEGVRVPPGVDRQVVHAG